MPLTGKDEKQTPKVRPYWHVDLKWISGILSIALISVSLVVFSLWRLSAPENAISISTLAVASAFSPEGLDEPIDTSEIQEDENGVIYLFDTKFISVTRSDLKELSPRELRLKIFSQITEPLYWQGAEELATEFSDDEQAADKFVSDARLISAINHQSHIRLRNILTVLLLTCATSLAALIYFSRRFGRLVSPAVVTLFGALPLTVAVLVLNALSQTGLGSEPGIEKGSRIEVVLSEIGPVISGALLPTLITIVTLSILALLTAIVLRIWKGKIDHPVSQYTTN